jgi:hypothetical protein
MSITQLSVFVENKPGHLAETFGTLAQGGVNVLNFTIADTADYGVLRLIVDDVERAKRALSEGGYTVVEHLVVGAFLPNVPGTLAAIMRMVTDSGLNVEYIYIGRRDTLVLKTEQLETLEYLLIENGFRVLQPGDLD